MAIEQYVPFVGAAAFAGIMVLVMLVIFAIIYVYTAFVWMTIARKLNYKKAWLAWIPIVRMVLLPILAKKRERAWPWVFIFLIPIVNIVFAIMWHWKIYERRKYPGWLSLIPLLGFIPVVSALAGIGHLIVLGFVAWYDR